jgi:hypothetical protein
VCPRFFHREFLELNEIFNDNLGRFGVVPPVPLNSENKMFETAGVVGFGFGVEVHGKEIGV